MPSRFSRCFSQRTLLLAVACACGDTGDTGPGGLASAGTGAASTGGSALGAGAVGANGGTAARPDAGGSSSGTPTGQGGGGDAGGAAGQPESPGGSGAEPLSPRLSRYHDNAGDRSLRFELDAVQGLSPYASSLEYLGGFVERVLDKPDGVAFDADETLAPAGSDHVWSFDELDAFARQHARDDADGPVSIHVLFVDGTYDSGEDGGTVLGLAWGQRYIALFQDPIRSGCSGLLGALPSESCEIAERNIWAHEIGHVIGLVDNGLLPQTDHRDTEHGRHDVSDGCLMYWAYDRPAIFDVLLSRLGSGQSADVDFCENCWADLNAARR